MSAINLHHIEIFYQMALHGGAAAARPHLPYGIGESALNSQFQNVEEAFGVRFAERKPFRLTAEGDELLEICHPFFRALDTLAERHRHGNLQRVRIAAPRSVLGLHLPPLLARVRQQFPGLRPRLRSGWRTQIEQWFRDAELDVAISVLQGRPPAGCVAEPLLRVPLCLVVPRSSPLRSADSLWQDRRVRATLVSPPAEDDVSRSFRAELAKRRIQWFDGMEADTLNLIDTYVVAGFGVGLSVMMPGRKFHPRVRVLPLRGFPELKVGLLWRRKPSPAAAELLQQVRAYAQSLRGG